MFSFYLCFESKKKLVNYLRLSSIFHTHIEIYLKKSTEKKQTINKNSKQKKKKKTEKPTNLEFKQVKRVENTF